MGRESVASEFAYSPEKYHTRFGISESDLRCPSFGRVWVIADRLKHDNFCEVAFAMGDFMSKLEPVIHLTQYLMRLYGYAAFTLSPHLFPCPQIPGIESDAL